MGSVSFAPGQFNDYLAELTGYKVDMALTLEELYDHLAGEKGYVDVSKGAEDAGRRTGIRYGAAERSRMAHGYPLGYD